MTKPRTTAELQEVLDREFAWRFHEIHDVKSLVRGAALPRSNSLIRAGVPLLYAHWEGFVKEVSTRYIVYVVNQGRPFKELRRSLILVGLRRYINIMQIEGMNKGESAVDFFFDMLDSKAKINAAKAINTRANLSSTVFEDVAATIGIESQKYKTKYKFLDESLLKRRNEIAHGKPLDVDKEHFGELVAETMELLRMFKNDVENAATLATYLGEKK